MVYVSCDPATLGRDVKRLREGGYLLQQAEAVDLFPRTGHVETVCLLSKQNPERPETMQERKECTPGKSE